VIIFVTGIILLEIYVTVVILLEIYVAVVRDVMPLGRVQFFIVSERPVHQNQGTSLY